MNTRKRGLDNKAVLFVPRKKRLRRFQAIMEQATILQPTLVLEDIRGSRQPVKLKFRLRVGDKRHIEYLYELMKVRAGGIDFHYSKKGIDFKCCEVVKITEERRKPGQRHRFKVEMTAEDFGPKVRMELSSYEHFTDPRWLIPIGYREVYKLRGL